MILLSSGTPASIASGPCQQRFLGSGRGRGRGDLFAVRAHAFVKPCYVRSNRDSGVIHLRCGDFLLQRVHESDIQLSWAGNGGHVLSQRRAPKGSSQRQTCAVETWVCGLRPHCVVLNTGDRTHAHPHHVRMGALGAEFPAPQIDFRETTVGSCRLWSEGIARADGHGVCVCWGGGGMLLAVLLTDC